MSAPKSLIRTDRDGHHSRTVRSTSTLVTPPKPQSHGLDGAWPPGVCSGRGPIHRDGSPRYSGEGARNSTSRCHWVNRLCFQTSEIPSAISFSPRIRCSDCDTYGLHSSSLCAFFLIESTAGFAQPLRALQALCAIDTGWTERPWPYWETIGGPRSVMNDAIRDDRLTYGLGPHRLSGYVCLHRGHTPD